LSRPAFCIIALALYVAASGALAETLTIGPDKKFQRLEEALAAANPGDVLLVSPRANNEPHAKVALLVTKPGLVIRADRAAGAPLVKLSGEKFEYTGRGAVPRAVVQFNPEAAGCTLEGFDISGAANAAHNAAGVRINQADNVVIRDCDIHHNNMGVMSGGSGTGRGGANQLIEKCAVHHNGERDEPGGSHNLYLGGSCVTVRFCEVDHALGGHNIKSRAHYTRIEYSYIHDSAHRELDLVESSDTRDPHSDAVVIGCVIAKDPRCAGNPEVIHFGQDGGGEHDGSLFVVYSTIVTPHAGAVVMLTAPKSRAMLIGNVIDAAGAKTAGQALGGGPSVRKIEGVGNWLSAGYTEKLTATGVDLRSCHVALGPIPLFVDAARRDFHLAAPIEMVVDVGPTLDKFAIPTAPGAAQQPTTLDWEYLAPHNGQRRTVRGAGLDLGAFEYAPAEK
jgi:hypothetical protein